MDKAERLSPFILRDLRLHVWIFADTFHSKDILGADFDGNFIIKPIPPGKYDVKATYVGYKPTMYVGVTIAGDQIQFLDIEMESTAQVLETFEVIDYKVPLISKDQTTSGASVTSEEIANA